jgi:hypothetical protein
VAGGGAGGAATGAGFKVCGKPAGAGMCRNNAPGVYAMRLDTDVWFFDENAKATSAPPLFSPGRGKLSIWFKTTISDICEDGSAGVAVNRTCGSVMPPIYADASSGVAQIVFPPELWDKPGMPEYTTVGSTSSFDVGATLKIAATPGLLGIKLADINGAFPTAAQTGTFKCEGGMGETCFTDPDGDMIPGVTVDIQTTGTPPDAPFPRTIAGQKWVYAPVPTDALAALSHEGATKLALGLRTNAGGEGVIGADCASGKGVADVGDFESRIIDCVKGTTACTLMESQFVDTVTPTFRVLKKDEVPGPDYKFVDGTGSVPKAQNDALDRSKSVGSTATVVRLGDIGTTFTCAQVRDALVGK